MKLFTIPALTALLATWACAVHAVVVPNADTPLFYLVSTSGTSSSNLLPVRVNGGSDYLSTLTGSGPIGQFYFYQGKLIAKDPAGQSNTYRLFINSVLTGSGCSPYGALGISPGAGSNKCASYGNFQIQSDTENSQLGAHLVLNYVGGFYACGATQDIYYKTSTSQPPSNCNSVQLYTVPVVV